MDQTMSSEVVAQAITGLPAALFVGSISGPLNEEANMLMRELDPKFDEIQRDLAATLELCHAGNEPAGGLLKNNVEALRSEVRSIRTMTAGLLNGTYVARRASERLHREASLSSFGPPSKSLDDESRGAQVQDDQEYVLEL